MVLGKFPVPGRPTNLDYSKTRAYCACNRCGWGLFGPFYSRLSLLFFFSLSLEDGPNRLKFYLKGPLYPKQPTNFLQNIQQPSYLFDNRFLSVRFIC